MSLKTPSTIIGPPANSLSEALESVFDDELQMVTEYDSNSHELLYVSDWFLNQHGGIDSVKAETDDLFNYYHLDFLERDFLADMLPLGEVETFVTFLDHGTVLRAQMDDAGVCVVLDVSASIDDAQITIQNALIEDTGVPPISVDRGFCTESWF